MGRVVGPSRSSPRNSVIEFQPARGVNPALAISGNRGKAKLRLRIATGNKLKVNIYRKSIAQQAINDITTIRETFGMNISEALRLSLHLTAQAIREGRIRL